MYTVQSIPDTNNAQYQNKKELQCLVLHVFPHTKAQHNGRPIKVGYMGNCCLENHLACLMSTAIIIEQPAVIHKPL